MAGCFWGVNPYDFANKIRDYVQGQIAAKGFNVGTVSGLLCGNLQAKRDFVPGAGHGKPGIANNEPLTTLAMILAYSGGQMEPYGASGGLYSIPSLADVDWLRLIDLFREAGVTDAELTLMGWNAASEAIRRERVGNYTPAIPDLSGRYDPYGYTVAVPDETTGEPERRPATQTDILGEGANPEPTDPAPPANPAGGPPATTPIPTRSTTTTETVVGSTPAPPAPTTVPTGGTVTTAAPPSPTAPYGYLIAVGLALGAGYLIFGRK